SFQPYLSAIDWVESGLPAHTLWWVELNGSATGPASDVPTITAEAVNGSYRYTIGSSNTSWAASGGVVSVEGTAQTIFVTFRPVVFGWTLRETGLPNGTAWAVRIDGVSYATHRMSETVELTNGSYRYTVISGNSSYRAMGGELSVNGSGGAVTVGFVPEVYAIEFA
ncbi:hypothetical protein B2A_06309, partial [mine drainage metagenome]